MNVSLIIGSFFPAVSYGGPIFSTLYLSKELASLGIKVFVSTTNANGEKRLDVLTNRFIQFEDNLFVKYYGGANRKSFSIPFLTNIQKDIRNTDIVYLQPIFSLYVPVVLFYSRLFKKIVLLSPRGSLGPWCLQSGSRFKSLWLKFFIKPFAGDIYWHATSEKEAKDIRLVLPDSRVSVIPNGIYVKDYKRFTALTRREYLKKFAGIETDCDYVLVSMGRLQEVKGFDILISSFNMIKDVFPSSVLVIAGKDYGEKENLKSLIKKYGLEKRVFFAGHLDGQDKVDFLANADLFALPSHHENFGLVYAEALAAGTPVVASTETPWSEVEKYHCGRWVKNDACAFAGAIEEIFKADFREMGQNGRRYVLERFDWKSIAFKFKKVFENMLNEKI